MHDEQLSSSASRICRMVAVASIQIAFFVAPVPGPRRWLSMVFLILCTRWCLNVRERRAPESQTPPIFPRFPPSLASLASLSLLLLLSAPLPLPLPAARCPLWWLVGVASRHFVSAAPLIHPTQTPPCGQNTPQQHQSPPRTGLAARVVSTCRRQQQHPCACTTHTCCRQGDRYRHCAACGARSLRFSQRGNALPSEKNSSAAKKARSRDDF